MDARDFTSRDILVEILIGSRIIKDRVLRFTKLDQFLQLFRVSRQQVDLNLSTLVMTIQ